MKPARVLLLVVPVVTVAVAVVALGSLTALAQEASRQNTKPGALEPIVSHTKAALSALREAHVQAAANELETALLLAREAAPLEVRKAVVVHARHTGLGIYDPAPQDAVKNRVLRLYVEVAGFGHRPLPPDLGGERYQVELDVTGEFFLDGESIGERGLGKHSFVTRTKSDVTSFGVEAKLGDKAPAGSYEVLLKVRDSSTNKSGSRRARFVIRQ